MIILMIARIPDGPNFAGRPSAGNLRRYLRLDPKMFFDSAYALEKVIDLPAIALGVAHARLQVLSDPANVRNLGSHIAKVLSRFFSKAAKVLRRFCLKSRQFSGEFSLQLF
jgi:hypothetical protein